MSGAGKKKKKTKGTTLNLTDFLAGDGTAPVVVAKPVTWGDEMEDDDEFDAKPIKAVVLPSAPRASRGPEFSLEDVPAEPPFTAFLGNLPFDVDEAEIERFFQPLEIANIRIPQGKTRGLAYAEFVDRQTLIDALGRNGEQLHNRNIRIDLANKQGGARDGDRDGRRGGQEDERAGRGDDDDQWRRREPGQNSFNDRGNDRYGGDRRGGFGDRDRGGYDDRDGGRRGGFGDRDQGNRDGPSRSDGDWGRRAPREDYERKDDGPPRARPSLKLQPRTKPADEETNNGPAPASSSSIFGGAKPVDTASREQKLEDRSSRPSEKPEPDRPKTNPFGNAKPVDIAAKEREIEKKLQSRSDPEGEDGRHPPEGQDAPRDDRDEHKETPPRDNRKEEHRDIRQDPDYQAKCEERDRERAMERDRDVDDRGGYNDRRSHDDDRRGGYDDRRDNYSRDDRDRGYNSRDSYDRDDRYNDRRNDGYGRRDDGYGRRDDGYGRRDDGYGRRDDGYGRRDDGYGRRDNYSRDSYDRRDNYDRRDDYDRRDNYNSRDSYDRRDDRDRDYGRRDDRSDDRRDEPSDSSSRPRLALQKRTKPVEDSTPKSSSIFGGAKPVDTYKKEKEIEQKLSKTHIEDDRSSTTSEDKQKEFKPAPAPAENPWTKRMSQNQTPPKAEPKAEPEPPKKTTPEPPKKTTPEPPKKATPEPKKAEVSINKPQLDHEKTKSPPVSSPPPATNAWSKKPDIKPSESTTSPPNAWAKKPEIQADTTTSPPNAWSRKPDIKPSESSGPPNAWARRAQEQKGEAGRGRGESGPWRGRGGGGAGRGAGRSPEDRAEPPKRERKERPLPKSVDEMPKYEEPKVKDLNDKNKFSMLMDEDAED